MKDFIDPFLYFYIIAAYCPNLRLTNYSYKPVCGTDGKSYTNAETLAMTNCGEEREVRVAYYGLCYADRELSMTIY